MWIVVRSGIRGVQLTATELVAHGYFRTHRYERQEIDKVEVVSVNIMTILALSLLRVNDSHAVSLTLANGSRRVLVGSISSDHDVEVGADIIRAWRG
jgi:hypothetical protein